MSKLNTKWRHNGGQIQGTVTEHNPKNGRVVLKLDNGRTYKGRIGNLKDNWTEIKETG